MQASNEETAETPLESRKKFSCSSYNDVPFAVAFFGNLLLVVTLMGYNIWTMELRVVQEAAASGPVALLQGSVATKTALGDKHYAVLLAFMSLFLGIVWAFAWLALLKSFPVSMIYVSLWFSAALMFIMAVVSLWGGSLLVGSITLVLACIMAVYPLWVKDRIEFTGKLLSCVMTVYKLAPGIFITAALALAVNAVFLCMWLLAAMPLYLTKDAAAPGLASWLALMLSLYWTAQVVANVVAVSCGGLMARWYFNHPLDNAVREATRDSCTYLFGSICLGSLLVAIIQTARALAASMKRDAEEDGNMVALALSCVAVCLLDCLESLAMFFNTYAFTFVAIYGVSFCRAGKEVFKLVQEQGIEVLFNYSLVGTVSLLGLLGGALLVSGLNALLAWRLGLNISFVVGGALLGFITTCAIMTIVSKLVESGATTLFVCYAQEPQKLLVEGKELHDAFGECKMLNAPKA